MDLEAAWDLVREFDEPGMLRDQAHEPVWHGYRRHDLRDAYVKAYQADSVSAFGSVIGFNQTLDKATAEELSKLFVEAVVAPGFELEALGDSVE